MEAVDISGDSYVDLLAIRRTRPGAGDPVELKVQMGPDGARLHGVTTTEIRGSHDLRALLKQLIKVVKKRNSTHTVTIRFTETFEFDDPENVGQSVTKSRRVQVVFVILRNLPAGFQRVVDVAVEHDSGENPLAKVPTRETAFTRLHPGIFTQGYNITFVDCLSPYYEHVRENVNTLIFSLKVQKLKGKPRQSNDESLVEMRRLADEVKGLKVTVRRQSEAMQTVQKELNAREVELMKREAKYNEVNTNLTDTRQRVQLMTVSRNIEVDKTNRVKGEMSKELSAKKKEMQVVEDNKTAKDKATKEVVKAVNDAKARTELLEKKIRDEEAKAKIPLDTIKAFEDEKAYVDRIAYINTASPEEQRAQFIESSVLHREDQKAIERMKEEMIAIKASDNTAPQIQKISAEYDKAVVTAGPSLEKDKLLKEIKQYEKETADAEAETKRLQEELDQKKAQCCSTM
ncbi:kinesin-like protein [Strigomonas culicis]|nr:kinesin-like protein [Strigomonas culicis]|eukprot:EPY19420.1 kinesin-like protein [Strigomonas culicis]